MKTRSTISSILDDFVSLIYPQTCCCCGTALAKHESQICLPCNMDLPIISNQTNVELKFVGKINFNKSLALYQYSKYNSVNKILEEIKYKDNQELAFMMGERLGNKLLANDFQNYDGIVPVPLHPSRLKYRGYNQSELLAQGISAITKLPVLSHLIRRNTATATQTRKQRFARWQNVETVFDTSIEAQNKRIILLDDVLTTGATLIACAESLHQKNIAEVSFIALASAI